MLSGGKSPDTAAMTMTEDAKTEENTAGSPCGAYIEVPCNFTTGNIYTHLDYSSKIDSANAIMGFFQEGKETEQSKEA